MWSPVFTGLGALYWDLCTGSAIIDITHGVNANHIIRAILEALAFQTYDLIESTQADFGERLKVLQVNSSAVANNFLMKFPADILGTRVEHQEVWEITARGAAYLVGLAVGFWRNPEEVRSKVVIEREFRSGVIITT